MVKVEIKCVVITNNNHLYYRQFNTFGMKMFIKPIIITIEIELIIPFFMSAYSDRFLQLYCFIVAYVK